MSKKNKSRERKQKCNRDSNWLIDYSKYMIIGIFAGIMVNVARDYDLGRFSLCSMEYWIGFIPQFLLLIILVLFSMFLFRRLYQLKEEKKIEMYNYKGGKKESADFRGYMKAVITGIFVGIAIGITQSLNIGRYSLLTNEYWVGFLFVIFICIAIISCGWFIFKRLS